jgi:hypothetical protein
MVVAVAYLQFVQKKKKKKCERECANTSSSDGKEHVVVLHGCRRRFTDVILTWHGKRVELGKRGSVTKC